MGTYLLRNREDLRKREDLRRFPYLRKREDLRRLPYLTKPESRNIKNLDDLRYWYQFQRPKIINSNTSIKIEDLPFNEKAHAALIRSLEEPAVSYENLYDCFVPMASPHQGFREDTEKELENASKASTYPNFAFALLRLIACPKGFSPEHDRLVCMAAARRLNDYVFSHKLFEIPNQERDYLKTLIFCLMLSPPFPSIDSLLDGALDVLCNGGKQSWHRLFWVPISKLNLEASHTSLTGSLIDDAKSIIRNFQEHRDRTNLFFNALHCCTYRMQKLVLHIFYKTVVSIRYPASNGNTIDHHLLLHIQCCRILSLSHWLLVSQGYLVHRYPRLKEEFSAQGGVLSTIDKLRFSVCENIALVLMSNHQERCYIYGSWDHELELELYIISPVIFLLQNLFASTSSSCDLLIVSAANCLMKSTSNDFIKSLVFREIVIPIVCVKDEDERLFEENCHEFIQSDMYASDSHTKRGIACNFLKKLVMKAEKEFATMLSKVMEEMLAYKDWKIKECAIYLVVMAEDAEGNSILSGMEERGCYFVDPNSFFKSVIEPELRSNKVNEFPMLKAAALKFLNKNSDKLLAYLTSDLMHSVQRFLHSKSRVIQAYASVSILVLQEKFCASSSSSHDQLIVSALNCLMDFNLSNFMMCHVSFGHILIRNVCLTDEDEILFKENYDEFIQRDKYASHCHTRRGIACNLIKKLIVETQGGFAIKLSEEISNMLNAMDWKSKECAIQLVVFLMAEDAEGNSILSEMEERGHSILDFYSFFNSVIEPELGSNDENELPMLKAAALKFLSKLLESFTRDLVHSVFPESLTSDLVHSVRRFLHSKSKVVSRYALDSAIVLLEKFPASQELEKLGEEAFKLV